MSATTFRRFDHVDELGSAAAELIAAGVSAAAAGGRSYLLGCPGGRTPRPIYAALARRCVVGEVDCSNLIIVMMDDYLRDGADPPQVVDDTAEHSCRRFAEQDIRGVINDGLPDAHRIPAVAVWFPHPSDPAAFDRRISEAGGVDLFIVASGASDGHVAFCGPGAGLDGGTSIVRLAATTRIDNTVTFPGLTSIESVPTRGISVGLGTIRKLSRSVVLVVHGADKGRSLDRVCETNRFDPDWPATFIHECANAQVWFDAHADGNRRPS